MAEDKYHETSVYLPNHKIVDRLDRQMSSSSSRWKHCYSNKKCSSDSSVSVLGIKMKSSRTQRSLLIVCNLSLASVSALLIFCSSVLCTHAFEDIIQPFQTVVKQSEFNNNFKSTHQSHFITGKYRKPKGSGVSRKNDAKTQWRNIQDRSRRRLQRENNKGVDIKPGNGDTKDNESTSVPSLDLSGRPSTVPTSKTTDSPTSKSTLNPTDSPTIHPSDNPTIPPSSTPSMNPSRYPTRNPTNFPTLKPSLSPTESPTSKPTTSPIDFPTSKPTLSPIDPPTFTPSSRRWKNIEQTTSKPTMPPTSTDLTLQPTIIHTSKQTQNPSLTVVDSTPKPTIWRDSVQGTINIRFSLMMEQVDEEVRKRNRFLANINSAAILSGEEPDLLKSLLSSMLTVLCSDTNFIILTKLAPEDEDGDTSHHAFKDFCSDSNEVIVLSSSSTNSKTILLADITGEVEEMIEVMDRIVFVANSNSNKDSENNIEFLHWLEFVIYYNVVQIGNDIQEEGQIDKINILNELNTILNRVVVNNIVDGTMDLILQRNDSRVIALSTVGTEAETFLDALNKRENMEENNVNAGNSANDAQTSDSGTPFFRTIRFVGILMLFALIVFVVVLLKAAQRKRKKHEWDVINMNRGKGGLVTQEGVDYMLEIGRSKTMDSMRKIEESTAIEDIAVTKVVVKPKTSPPKPSVSYPAEIKAVDKDHDEIEVRWKSPSRKKR